MLLVARLCMTYSSIHTVHLLHKTIMTISSH